MRFPHWETSEPPGFPMSQASATNAPIPMVSQDLHTFGWNIFLEPSRERETGLGFLQDNLKTGSHSQHKTPQMNRQKQPSNTQATSRQEYGCGSKMGTQNGTLANGTMDENLRSISWWFHFGSYPYYQDSGRHMFETEASSLAGLRFRSNLDLLVPELRPVLHIAVLVKATDLTQTGRISRGIRLTNSQHNTIP